MVERIKHPLTFFFQNARPRIIDLQNHLAFVCSHGKIDLPAVRRVANRIVHKIFDQRFQIRFSGYHVGIPTAYHARVNVFGLRQRHQLFQHLTKNVLYRHRSGLLMR